MAAFATIIIYFYVQGSVVLDILQTDGVFSVSGVMYLQGPIRKGHRRLLSHPSGALVKEVMSGYFTEP